MTTFEGNNSNQDLRLCYYCFEHLPLSSFQVDRREKDGYSKYCAKCRYIIQKYRKSPEKVFLHELPIAYRNRAIIKSLPWDSVWLFDCVDRIHQVRIHYQNPVKIAIYENKKLKGSIEFVDAKTDICIEWLLEYLLKNKIFITTPECGD